MTLRDKLLSRKLWVALAAILGCLLQGTDTGKEVAGWLGALYVVVEGVIDVAAVVNAATPGSATATTAGVVALDVQAFAQALAQALQPQPTSKDSLPVQQALAPAGPADEAVG